MKRTGLLLTIIVTLFAGCKNDVNILAPYKDTPVIYCLLDQSDTTHYVRVNKAFEGSGNAYTMAQQYDSINYPAGTITVQLQNLNTNAIITLGTTTAIPVDPGIFSYPNQVLYYTHTKLDSSAQYKLIVTNNKTGKVCTGVTGLLQDVPFSTPLDFMTPTAISLTTVTPFPPTPVTWTTNAQAAIYQLVLRFYYNEIDTIKKDTARDYVDWVFAPHTISINEAGNTQEDNYSGTAFMQFLNGSLSVASPRTIKRVPVNMKVMFTSGSLDFYTYIELSQPSLTVNQQKPFFSDVTNGIGIYTGRHTQTAVKPLSASTVTLLDTDATVKALNFKPY